MTAAAPIRVVDEPFAASALLSPLRRRMIEALVRPASAAGLARQFDLPRQKVNYHLRELEKAGLVATVEQRTRGNCVERLVQATAESYVIDPGLLGRLADGPAGPADRFSSSWLIARAARLIRDVATLRRRAASVRKQLPTITIETDVRFASATGRNAFVEELAQCVAELTAKYHDDTASDGRRYSFVVAGHPTITKTEAEARAETARNEEETP